MALQSNSIELEDAIDVREYQKREASKSSFKS